jgi:hypothetical protein
MAAEAVTALMNHHRPLSLDLADQLMATDVHVFDSRPVAQLLRVALVHDPPRFAPQLVRALACPDSVARRAGQVWAMALVRDAIKPPAPNVITELPAGARRGAAEALATDPALATDVLITLFDDPDPAVRQAAAHAARRINDIDDATAEIVVSAFVNSSAFDEHFDELFLGLDRRSGPYPSATLTACELAIKVAQHQLGDIRTHRVLTSGHVISVVLRLYRESEAMQRGRCLDLIDSLADAGAYGLDEALAEER